MLIGTALSCAIVFAFMYFGREWQRKQAIGRWNDFCDANGWPHMKKHSNGTPVMTFDEQEAFIRARSKEGK